MEQLEMMEKLLLEQLALGEKIQATAQWLRFVLSVTNEDLNAIREQLIHIREIASGIEVEPSKTGE